MLNKLILLQITDPVDVPTWIVIGGSIVVVLILIILPWFRSKELTELKTIDNKILAAGLGLEYARGSASSIDKLKNLGLITRATALQPAHLFEYSSNNADVQLLGASYTVEDFPRDLTYIWIQFNHIQLPSFEIVDARETAQKSPFDSSSKIPRTNLTSWISSNLDVLKSQASTTPSADIEEILSRCSDISYLLDSDDFERLTTNSNHLCYWISEKLLVDSNQLARLKVIADHLVDVFDAAAKPTSDLDEIERLKRDEQG